MEISILSDEQIYRLGVTYFKENEGKSFSLQFEDRLKLLAFKQQANHGDISKCELPPLGTLDVIGKKRRAAWSQLGDMGKEEAKIEFVKELKRLVPTFQQFLDDQAAEQQKQLEQSREEEKERQIREEKARAVEKEKQVEEQQRRAIQDALNRQTWEQFKSYAEQQYPDNPDQQAVQIKQLQEQHYYQYMQQVYQQQAAQLEAEPSNCTSHPDDEVTASLGTMTEAVPSSSQEDDRLAAAMHGMHVQDEDEECHEEQEPETDEAAIWTRKDINDFKEMIRKEESDAIIKVGHGESVTVRVPTHKDGKSLYWEFATDHHDIGFGLFFEWVEVEDTQVTVHISDSEDEEDEEYISEEEGGDGGGGGGGRGFDPESGKKGLLQDNGPPTSCIVPILRRDCHEEVYAGSHTYPGQGVYLLKFDNTYSLWRSKTLYYRVYYTR